MVEIIEYSFYELSFLRVNFFSNRHFSLLILGQSVRSVCFDPRTIRLVILSSFIY